MTVTDRGGNLCEFSILVMSSNYTPVLMSSQNITQLATRNTTQLWSGAV